MKRTVQAFVTAQGHTSHYSGHTKTLYVTGPNAEHVELQIIKTFGMGLPFKTASQTEQMINPKPVNKYSKAGKEVANG